MEIQGGGLIGAYAINGTTAIGSFDSVTFSGNSIRVRNAHINGGGLIGALNINGDVSIGSFTSTSFLNNEVEVYNAVKGGALIGAFTENGNVEIGSFSNVKFIGNKINAPTYNDTWTDRFLVGGLIGAHTLGTSNVTVKLGSFENALFQDNTVSSRAAIYGSGFIGVRNQNSGGAEIGSFKNSNFINNNLDLKGQNLQGGGLIGAYTQFDDALIGEFDTVNFSKNRVFVEGYDSIQGGGLIGTFSYYSYSPSYYGGNGEVGSFNRATFTDNDITMRSNVHGGGLVGVFASNKAILGDFTDSVFTGNKINSGGKDYPNHGGGLIGTYVFGYYNGSTSVSENSEIGKFTNVTFTNNTVDFGYTIYGGGLVGASNIYERAAIGNLTNVKFVGNRIAMNYPSTNYGILGGGLVGTYSSSYNLQKPSIVSNVKSVDFINNTIASSGYIHGGGLVGGQGAVSVGLFDYVNFSGNRIETGGDLYGGGLVGGFSSVNDDVTLAGFENMSITNNAVFLKIMDSSGYDLSGGGLIGARTSNNSSSPYIAGDATVGAFKNINITQNTITSDFSIQGGGLVGVHAGSSNDNGSITALLESFDSVNFIGNTVKVDPNSYYAGLQGGGLVGTLNSSNNSAGWSIVGQMNNVKFQNNILDIFDAVYGGGIVGARNPYGFAEIKGIADAVFSNNTLSMLRGSAMFQGGGLVGANSNYNGAFSKIGIIERVDFSDNTITVASFFHGGGIVGAFNGNGSGAFISSINDVKFTRNIIDINDPGYNSGGTLAGGGIVGAYSVGSSNKVIAGDFINVTFTDNSVTARGRLQDSSNYLHGGGLIGAFNNSSWGSNAVGGASIGSLTNVKMIGNTVDTNSTLGGGGLIGVLAGNDNSSYPGGAATIGAMDGIVITGNDVSFYAGSYSGNSGGGLIGVYHSASYGGVGEGRINNISNAVISNNTIDLTGVLYGAGIIGARSPRNNAFIGDFTAVSFENNTVVNRDIYVQGAGMIGALSNDGKSIVGDFKQARFINNSFTGAVYLQGGGMIGTFSNNSDSSVGSFDTAEFKNNSIAIGGYLQGGGLVGAYSSGHDVSIGSFNDAAFLNNNISVNDTIYGGGLIGALSWDYNPVVGYLSGTRFIGNKVSATGNLFGGGVVGVWANNLAGMKAKTGSIQDSAFEKNTISVGNSALTHVLAMGSVLGYSGLDTALTIRNTSFVNNTMTVVGATIDRVGGTVYVGTDRTTTNGNGHQVVLSADRGEKITFFGNQIKTYANNQEAVRNSSLYFGRQDPGRDSQANAALDLYITGGEVYLYDPIMVDLNNNQKFAMSVYGTDGFARFGGENIINTPGAASTVLFANGVDVTHASDYTLKSTDAGTSIAATIKSGVNFSFDASRDVNVAIFDFAGAGSGSLTVENGAVLSIDPARQLTDISGDFLIVTGISDAERNAAAQNFVMGDGILGFDVTASGQLSVNAQYHSPYAALLARNANTMSSIVGLQEVVKDLNISNADFDAMIAGSNALTAEHSMDSALTAGVTMDNLARTALTQKKCALDGRACPWISYAGYRMDDDGKGGYQGFKGDSDAVVIGAGYTYNENIDFGGYFAYSSGKTKLKEVNSKVDTDAMQAGLYGNYQLSSKLKLSTDIGFAWFDNDAKRSMSDVISNGSFDQNAFTVGLGLSYEHTLGEKTKLSPFINMRYSKISQDEFTESGIAGNHVQGFDYTSAESVLGAVASHALAWKNLKTYLSVGWKHQFGDERAKTTASYSGALNQAFTLSSNKDDRDAVSLGLGLSTPEYGMMKNLGLSFRIGYALDVSAHGSNNSFSSGFELKF